jgi:hypothetical protein
MLSMASSSLCRPRSHEIDVVEVSRADYHRLFARYASCRHRANTMAWILCSPEIKTVEQLRGKMSARRPATPVAYGTLVAKKLGLKRRTHRGRCSSLQIVALFTPVRLPRVGSPPASFQMERWDSIRSSVDRCAVSKRRLMRRSRTMNWGARRPCHCATGARARALLRRQTFAMKVSVACQGNRLGSPDRTYEFYKRLASERAVTSEPGLQGIRLLSESMPEAKRPAATLTTGLCAR